MTCDLKDVIGKTVAGVDYQAVIFTDGTVLQWDHDGCEAVYTAEEWDALGK